MYLVKENLYRSAVKLIEVSKKAVATLLIIYIAFTLFCTACSEGSNKLSKDKVTVFTFTNEVSEASVFFEQVKSIELLPLQMSREAVITGEWFSNLIIK